MTMPQNKRWIEISVEAEKTALDDLVNLLGRHCVGGAVVEERPGALTVVKGFLPEWESATAEKLEIALLLLGKAVSISRPVIRVMAPEDWTESWKSYFEPQHIGQRTVIVPTWREYIPKPGELIIHLDPGMAFGTGLHATTRLCLAAIEREIKPGTRALDVGTGSGILAISMAKQGASQIVAIDIDPVAVHVAQDNLVLNNISQVTVAQETLASSMAGDNPIHYGQDYDLLTVNIFADVIIAMARAISQALRQGGMFIASGIIASRAEDVALALAQVGLMVENCQQEDDWVVLVGHKA
jgi:ribosomal protein L11 methyltransferase